MPFRRIAILFEYGTLNGGERSMLAAMDRLRVESSPLEFVALTAETGRLTEALSQRGVSSIPFALRDADGCRLPLDLICQNLLRAVHESGADLVHANSLAMGRLTGRLADRLDVPCTAHLRDIIKISQSAMSDLNRNRRLIAVSEATRGFHVAQGLDADRTCIIHNGVDTERFRPRPATGGLKRELGVPADAFCIATIGQIGLRKAQDVLAEAAALLAVSRQYNMHYLLIGERHSTKPESIEFERRVVERFDAVGLRDRLHRLGYRDDVPEIMNEVDLLVHPARQEPLGRVLLEAAAAGLPIIATVVGGTTEILRDGESARLVPPDDPQSLAAAIVELHDDPHKRSRFAAAARARIETAFAIDRAAHKLAAAWTC